MSYSSYYGSQLNTRLVLLNIFAPMAETLRKNVCRTGGQRLRARSHFPIHGSKGLSCKYMVGVFSALWCSAVATGELACEDHEDPVNLLQHGGVHDKVNLTTMVDAHVKSEAYRKLEMLKHPSLDLMDFDLPSSKVVSNSSRIVVVSHCVPDSHDYAEICKIAHQNFKQYCQLQGCQLIFTTKKMPGMGKRHGHWDKVIALQAALKKPDVDYVFWMDSDALFMNQSVRLETLLPSGDNQIAFSRAVGCFISSGQIMLKKGKWADTFLRKVWEVYPPPKPWNDQAAMAYVLSALSPEEKNRKGGCRARSHKCCQSDVIQGAEVQAKTVMNSNRADFKTGHFIVHMNGGLKQKLGNLKRFAQQVLLPA